MRSMPWFFGLLLIPFCFSAGGAPHPLPVSSRRPVSLLQKMRFTRGLEDIGYYTDVEMV